MSVTSPRGRLVQAAGPGMARAGKALRCCGGKCRVAPRRVAGHTVPRLDVGETEKKGAGMTGSSGRTGRPLCPDEPTSIGDYRLLAMLGEGGMGRVYLARAPTGRR